MTTYKYSYTVDQFLNNQYDLSKLDNEIRDSSIVVALDYLSGDTGGVDIHFKAQLSSGDWTTLSGVVAAHDGEDDFTEYTPIKIMEIEPGVEQPVVLSEEYRDRSGKLRVHQTPRKLGLATHWSGRGDDPTDINDVGNGQIISLEHNISDDSPHLIYIDFNCMDNETWICEGYITWNDAEMDSLSVDAVPRLVKYGLPGIGTATFYGDGLNDCTSSGTYSGSTSKEYRVQIDSEGTPDTFKWSDDGGGTWTENVSITGVVQTLSSGVQVTFAATTGHTLNDYWCINAVISNPTTYKLYGPLIVPYTFPLGTPVDVISDLTSPILDGEGFGGLIYIPNDDLNLPPTAFWNADWNTTTKKFENITAVPTGTGRYNIFASEMILSRYFNTIPLLSNTTIRFTSADADQLGHGVRIKATATTNTTTVPDHAWSCACIMCLYREKTI